MNSRTTTWSGRVFDLLNPHPLDVSILDIAHALSHICRFNGHTDTYYSVAAHSLNVYEQMKADGLSLRMCLLGLCHDFSEAYICDIPTPLKPLLANYKQIESNVQHAILTAFQIEAPNEEEEKVIKTYDKKVFYTELSLLTKLDRNDFEAYPIIDLQYISEDPRSVRTKVLTEFYRLWDGGSK